MTRFSKTSMTDALIAKSERLATKFGFDANNATAQLVGPLDNRESVIAYGKFRACHDLIRQIEDGSLFRRGEDHQKATLSAVANDLNIANIRHIISNMQKIHND